MSRFRFYVLIDQERCKGCELCVKFCPRGVLRISEALNSFGRHPAEVANADACTGCGACAAMCPDACIEIWRAEAAQAQA